MKLKPLTATIYAATAVTNAAWYLVSISEAKNGIAISVCFYVPLLLFTYAYGKTRTDELDRLRPFLIYIGAPLAFLTITFCLLATPYWTNPLRGDKSLPLPISLLIAPIFFLTPVITLVSALSLLIRRKSSLSVTSLVLLWPALFLLAIASTSGFFQETRLNAAWYFLGFCSPLLISFAAGVLSARPILSHMFALVGSLVAFPWHYRSEVVALPFTNSWIVFNIPDSELGFYYNDLTPARLSILSVTLLTITLVIAILRLLPEKFQVKGSTIRDWTWPAVALAALVLSVWLIKAAMPYRIPGALDRTAYPVFQILHVEKHGLQFHEKCVSFYDPRRWGAQPITVNSDDRHLFQYRFTLTHAAVPPSSALQADLARNQADLRSFSAETSVVQPIRAWNADDWYVNDRLSGFYAFTTQNGKAPPPGLIALFQEADRSASIVPPLPRGLNQLKDVCLGLCFDQSSAMGVLYSSDRCHGDRCR